MIFLRLSKELDKIMHGSTCHSPGTEWMLSGFVIRTLNNIMKSYTISHSHKQCIRVSIAPHSHWYLYILFLKNYYSKIVSHCGFNLWVHFCKANNIEYLLLCLSTICISSIDKCLFKSFAIGIIAALFTIKKTWEQLKGPSMDD